MVLKTISCQNPLKKLSEKELMKKTKPGLIKSIFSMRSALSRQRTIIRNRDMLIRMFQLKIKRHCENLSYLADHPYSVNTARAQKRKSEAMKQ